ncbi:MAG: 50S ribosomal protein L6 [Lachnospiraceae bacterium]|nr:50S ribosomal protein L6 [Lachnospiraceae bacterium]
MSRIGKKPITILNGVTVDVKGNEVTVKGSKGTLTKTFVPEMKITVEDGHVKVERPDNEKRNKSLHGLTRTLINNMIIGVTEGYEKTLEINGVGYKASKQGKKLNLSLGYSHPVVFNDPDGLETQVPDERTIIVKGIDKEKVGQYAAEIRGMRGPEPYKGKGIKYKDEHINRKVGKTGKK